MDRKDKIDISRLLKAQKVFERFRRDMCNDRDQAGATQAFEFCYELSWKMMKRILAHRGQETGSPKDTFRRAALEKIIDDPQVWFTFLNMRNLTVHTYEEENLQAIVDHFDLFSRELTLFIERIQNLL